MATGEIRDGRSFDRLINFSDAIVAVAVTVLVLPIAGLSIERGEATVWEVLGDHRGEIITFFFTFFVVSVMWLTHNRAMNELRGYDGTIFWLNTSWLYIIAFLPVTSALYGDSEAGWAGAGGDLGGSGMLYWGSLALISLNTTLIVRHARKNPDLYESEQSAYDTWRTKYRGWIYVTYFLSIGVVSLFSPTISSYMPIGFFFLPLLLNNPGSSTTGETKTGKHGS